MKGIVSAASKAKCLLKAPGLRHYAPVAKTAPLPTFRGEKTAILCPGQGAQYVGMLQNLSPGIEEPLREMTSEILGYDLVKICRNGPKEILDRLDSFVYYICYLYIIYHYIIYYFIYLYIIYNIIYISYIFCKFTRCFS